MGSHGATNRVSQPSLIAQRVIGASIYFLGPCFRAIFDGRSPKNPQNCYFLEHIRKKSPKIPKIWCSNCSSTLIGSWRSHSEEDLHQDINSGNVGYYNGGMYAARNRCSADLTETLGGDSSGDWNMTGLFSHSVWGYYNDLNQGPHHR